MKSAAKRDSSFSRTLLSKRAHRFAALFSRRLCDPGRAFRGCQRYAGIAPSAVLPAGERSLAGRSPRTVPDCNCDMQAETPAVSRDQNAS